MTRYSPKTNRAIKNYGFDVCVEAFRRHDRDGEGASFVGFYLGLRTNQADAAIDSGREIADAAALRVSYTTADGRKETKIDGLSVIDAQPKVVDAYTPSPSERRNRLVVAHLNRVAPGWTSFQIP